MMKKRPFVNVDRLHFGFSGLNQTAVLRNVSFNIFPGEFAAFVGPSGVGKTTLLKLLAGLLNPSKGELTVGGKKPSELNGKIGLVFQHYTAFPWLTAEQNIRFGLDTKKMTAKERNQKIQHLLDITQLNERRHYLPKQLSGGQKQRVALARTLATEPMLLLLDEPFGALDAITRNQIQQSLFGLFRELQPTAVLVTHDIEEALFLADRIFVLQGQPAIIRAVIKNPLPKPRNAAVRYTADFQKAKQELLRSLGAE